MIRLFIIIVLMCAIAVQGIAQEKPHAYIGAQKCSMCHKGEKKGMVFEKWQGSAHASAYSVLAGQLAKDVYTKLGKTGNPQEDASCLKCHVTGHGAPAEVRGATLTNAEGVSCEACHGAGADYMKMNIMKDKALSVAAGMVADPKAGCVSCHNDKSPTYKGFKMEEMYPKIEHKVPKVEG